ncbi:ParE-like toxin of type II ParDE toxin-antitoxin system [Mucilaginibacter yixingensis]|uniref:ParE-like toxin of type II ParDE toxin-antitoxin system n=1 Tax=Mucilaginibacter yixingensis TaxID=1295612 RepID=A0A2T5JDZ3_9SPHI|nr:type II toxin-antitoxin system RelE/ParE family toxin [Mucilaginibacter yixingensis]PTQ99991.1 ParE-like toxin of type II ParDE toxin-antitoxin system [Mucilaginibacter yixingensis]
MSSIFSVKINEKALHELEASVKWYEEELPGLGERFFVAVREKIRLIVKGPYLYKSLNEKYRQAVLADFPFVIVYWINEQQQIIIISAIFHTSRRPNKRIRK